jgi:hypothetical protein
MPYTYACMPAAFHETLDTAGSVEDLVNLLQSARDLCAAAGGPKACIELLQSSKSLVVAAGGAREVWHSSTIQISICNCSFLRLTLKFTKVRIVCYKGRVPRFHACTVFASWHAHASDR